MTFDIKKFLKETKAGPYGMIQEGGLKKKSFFGNDTEDSEEQSHYLDIPTGPDNGWDDEKPKIKKKMPAFVIPCPDCYDIHEEAEHFQYLLDKAGIKAKAKANIVGEEVEIYTKDENKARRVIEKNGYPIGWNDELQESATKKKSIKKPLKENYIDLMPVGGGNTFKGYTNSLREDLNEYQEEYIQIAKDAGSYESAVERLEDYGVNRMLANQIASDVWTEEGDLKEYSWDDEGTDDPDREETSNNKLVMPPMPSNKPKMPAIPSKKPSMPPVPSNKPSMPPVPSKKPSMPPVPSKKPSMPPVPSKKPSMPAIPGKMQETLNLTSLLEDMEENAFDYAALQAKKHHEKSFKLGDKEFPVKEEDLDMGDDDMMGNDPDREENRIMDLGGNHIQRGIQNLVDDGFQRSDILNLVRSILSTTHDAASRFS